MYMAGADIRDCFYGCRCPPGLEDFFCLKDDLTFAEWDLVTGGNGDASMLGPRICHCITVLPMGFTWSFYIIQALHEQISLRSLHISEDHLIRDAHPPPSLSGKDVAAMPYCDNESIPFRLTLPPVRMVPTTSVLGCAALASNFTRRSEQAHCFQLLVAWWLGWRVQSNRAVIGFGILYLLLNMLRKQSSQQIWFNGFWGMQWLFVFYIEVVCL